MPSSYTAPVKDGTITEFGDFARLCARAMGALIMMRDEPLNAPVADAAFAPTDYYTKELAAAQYRLNWLNSMTDAQRDSAARNAYESEMLSYSARLIENANVRLRYAAMMEKVLAWKAPTPDHEGLRDYMISQLTDSARFDVYEPKMPVVLSGQVWWGQEVAELRCHIASCTKHHEEEVQRCNQRREWYEALVKSLDGA